MDAADQIKALGDLEYRADLEPYLDPVSRYGFDPEVFQTGSQRKGFGPQAYSHYDRMDDIVNISESGLPSKSTQSHEYRHRGFANLFKQYRKNPDFYEEEYPGIGGLLRELMGGRSGFNETITEFYDTDETYNLPAQYETTTPYSRGRTLGEDAGVVLARGRDYTDDPYVIERKDGLGMQVKKKTNQISGPARLDADSPEDLARRQNFIDYREQAPEDRDTENNILFNKILLLEQMAEDEYKNPKNFAQGGPVMRGIGTLNETARNMTRGPRGIGAYQQFMGGGEAMGPPPMRGPDPYGIPQYADGGPIYMNRGGVSDEVSARRASTEDLDNLVRMVEANYGFDPVAVALEQGIDPELALRVMYEESKGKQSAGSEKGARGLMQLMPGTAEELGVDINDALDNYTGGLKYLKKMTSQFGLEKGLAAYNAGPGNVEKYQGVPPFKETQNYLRIIAEPFTGISVESLINTGSENFMMKPPVFNEEAVARGRGVRPQLRPEGLGSSAPLTSLRPQLRPAPEPTVSPALRPLALPEGRSMVEKYGLPGDMPQGGIMSAMR